MINLNKIEVKYMPDGMPHIKLKLPIILSDNVNIRGSIRSMNDLLILGQVVDILRHNNFKEINLTIDYLLGSRMDRAISHLEPNTLKVVCDFINSLQLNKIMTVFAHSPSTLDRLNAISDTNTERNFLIGSIRYACRRFNTNTISIVLPDAGAEKRFWNDHSNIVKNLRTVHQISIDFITSATKHRDMQTGKLSGFQLNGSVGKNAIILDDLGDGMGTFAGLGSIIKKQAEKLAVAVYHGIFSKGLPIENIDHVYTSNSFKDDLVNSDYLTVYKI